jgi:hypothetical protein
MSPQTKGWVMLIGESGAIFIVSIVLLFVVYMTTGKNATGIVWVHWKGLVLIGVGVMYLASGTILLLAGK